MSTLDVCIHRMQHVCLSLSLSLSLSHTHTHTQGKGSGANRKCKVTGDILSSGLNDKPPDFGSGGGGGGGVCVGEGVCGVVWCLSILIYMCVELAPCACMCVCVCVCVCVCLHALVRVPVRASNSQTESVIYMEIIIYIGGKKHVRSGNACRALNACIAFNIKCV